MSKANNRFTVLILGGYGTFGKRIALALCQKGYHVVINGRNHEKAKSLLNDIINKQHDAKISTACFDVYTELTEQLTLVSPDLVIHTCGPFQGQDTQIAQIIIRSGCHYIDLSDGREYVGHMMELNELAQQHGVIAITAASTVPTLSSAALTYLQNKYQIVEFDQVKMGISPGQKTERGLATTKAVLSYIGKQIPTWRGNKSKAFGWQNIYLQKYPHINNRLMGNCEAPDLDWLQDYFAIKKLRFSAGMESKLLHMSIWLCSWLIRLKLPLKLPHHASFLLKASRWFDVLGSDEGGMHIDFTGTNKDHKHVHKTWYIEAKKNDGPQIPSIPAIVLTEKVLNHQITAGVHPSIQLMTLEEYLAELADFSIQTSVS